MDAEGLCGGGAWCGGELVRCGVVVFVSGGVRRTAVGGCGWEVVGVGGGGGGSGAGVRVAGWARVWWWCSSWSG